MEHLILVLLNESLLTRPLEVLDEKGSSSSLPGEITWRE